MRLAEVKVDHDLFRPSIWRHLSMVGSATGNLA
jgi:hypothetical protein